MRERSQTFADSQWDANDDLEAAMTAMMDGGGADDQQQHCDGPCEPNMQLGSSKTSTLVLEGNMIDGSLHGHCRVVYANGDKFDGTFAHGVKEGWGTYTAAATTSNEAPSSSSGGGSGTSIRLYEGEFKDNKMHGVGKAELSSGDKYTGCFAANRFHDPLTTPRTAAPAPSRAPSGAVRSPSTSTGAVGGARMEFSDGKLYEGSYARGQRNGIGYLQQTSGDFYEGSFVNGKMEGSDSRTVNAKTKRVFLGTVRDNGKKVKGRMIFPDGKCYDGDWQKDRPHGSGWCRTKNADLYHGDWCNGQMHGPKGVLIYASNRKRFEGEFSEDKPVVAEGVTTATTTLTEDERAAAFADSVFKTSEPIAASFDRDPELAKKIADAFNATKERLGHREEEQRRRWAELQGEVEQRVAQNKERLVMAAEAEKKNKEAMRREHGVAPSTSTPEDAGGGGGGGGSGGSAPAASSSPASSSSPREPREVRHQQQPSNNNDNQVGDDPDDDAGGASRGPRLLKRGWMDKFSIGKSFFGAKNWKRRYFMLATTGLAYFKGADPNSPPLGHVPCGEGTHARLVTNPTQKTHKEAAQTSGDGGSRDLCVIYNDKGSERRLLLRCESEGEHQQWVGAFSQIIKLRDMPADC